MSVEVVVERSCNSIGEGPHWDGQTQSLLYVDINDGDLHKWDSRTGKNDKIHFDKTLSLVVPCSKGGYILGLGQTLAHFDWDSGKVSTLKEVDQDKDTRFNDGKCDPAGRLWAGTMGNEVIPAHPPPNQGTLFMLDLDGSIHTKKEPVSISNGMAWTADNKTMYYIDSVPRKVYGYDYDLQTGTISNERIVIDFGGEETLTSLGYPDGMAIDLEGKIWVACYGVGKVIRFDPETGKELRTVNIPAMRTTSCCFGGKNMDELFVTCARYAMTDEEKEKTPLAGSIFRVTGLNTRGAPANMYQG